MTAAADLTPKSTVDPSAGAEPAVDQSVGPEAAEPTESSAVDAPEAVEPVPAESAAASAGAEAADDEPAVDSVDAAPAETDADKPAQLDSTLAEPAIADEPVEADSVNAATAGAEPAADSVAAVPADTAEPAPKDSAADVPADAGEPADAAEPAPAELADADEPAYAAEPADADEPAPAEPADAAEPAYAAEPAPAEPASAEPVATPPVAPRPVPRPVAPQRIAPQSTASAGAAEPWGRVDEDGTVSVREAEGWRVVGQYPDGSPEEALAYFERKYADLASEVGLLEVRHRRGGASAADLRTAARAVNAKLEGAAAVGDLASLVARVAALTQSLAAASETEAAAAREAVDDAVRSRTELVEKVEAIAAREPRTVQWKQASAEVSALFDQWQSDQQNGPRLPKSTAQQLWKRFRDARATFDKHRREFYAELDEAHKGVRDRKTRLVERAEALAPKGEDGIPAYRDLLDEWKTAGRAGKKVDDALWARFKAAGDALYSARIERETADAEASREKIEAKRALLEEARAVADEREIVKARALLTGIQRRWDEIGRVLPRESERSLDDELRKIEQGLRTREEADWKRNNPETKARANEMTRQLTEAIEKLEDALAKAEKSGDKAAIAKAAEALEARRSWLKALGG